MQASAMQLSNKPLSPVQARPQEHAVVSRPWVSVRTSASRTEEAVTGTEPASTLIQGHGSCPVLSQLPLAPPPVMGPLEDFLLARKKMEQHVRESQAGRDITQARLLGVLPSVFVGTATAVKDVFAQEPTGAVIASWPESLRKLIGEGSVSVVTDPAEFKMMRKVLVGALSHEQVDWYLTDIHGLCVNMLESWVTTCAAGHIVMASQQLKSLTMQVMTRLILDMPLSENELKEVLKDFLIWVRQLFDPFPYDVWPLPFYHSMRARNRLVVRIENRLEQLHQEMTSGPPQARISMLQRLTTGTDEQGNKLSHKQVVDNLLGLLFGGYDTTASLLTRVLFDLATHPEVLSKVRAEQQQVMSRHGPQMTPAALKEMQYTAAVLRESHRVAPIAFFVARLAKEDVAVGGHRVPAGQTVVLNYGNMLSNDPRWPADGDPATNLLHPANFNPDRFMTELGQKQGWQVPFGAGQHACPGQALAQAEAKIFLATLARGYGLVADTSTEWIFNPVGAPANGLPIWLTRRQM